MHALVLQTQRLASMLTSKKQQQHTQSKQRHTHTRTGTRVHVSPQQKMTFVYAHALFCLVLASFVIVICYRQLPRTQHASLVYRVSKSRPFGYARACPTCTTQAHMHRQTNAKCWAHKCVSFTNIHTHTYIYIYIYTYRMKQTGTRKATVCEGMCVCVCVCVAHTPHAYITHTAQYDTRIHASSTYTTPKHAHTYTCTDVTRKHMRSLTRVRSH